MPANTKLSSFNVGDTVYLNIRANVWEKVEIVHKGYEEISDGVALFVTVDNGAKIRQCYHGDFLAVKELYA